MPRSPKKVKRKPQAAAHLTPAAVAAPPGSNTLDRVIHCIDPYTNIQPILATYHVGSLCPDLDYLGADLNVEFRLRGRQRFWHGEIESGWEVRYLSDYTKLKKAEAP